MKSKVRRCAEWCGRGCTKAEHDKAVRIARALVRQLGPGWRPRVWENLGWHSEAVSRCGRITVHQLQFPKGQVHHTAYLGEPGCGGGRWVESSSDPRVAVSSVIAAARRDLARIGAVLKGLA